MHRYRIYRSEKGSTLPEAVLFPGGRANSAPERCELLAVSFSAAVQAWEDRGLLSDVEDGENIVVLNTSEGGGLAVFTAVKPPAPTVIWQRA